MAPKKLPKGKNTYFVFIVVSYRFSLTNLLKLNDKSENIGQLIPVKLKLSLKGMS